MLPEDMVRILRSGRPDYHHRHPGIDLLDSPKFGADKDFELEEGRGRRAGPDARHPGKDQRPVRMYLREMGTVPLLTREARWKSPSASRRPVACAQGHFRARPSVIREIVALGEDSSAASATSRKFGLRREELTETGADRVKATVTRIDLLVKHQKKIAVLEEKQALPVPKAKARHGPPHRWLVAAKKCSSRALCAKLKYTALERKRLLDKVNKTVDTMRTLERQIRSLEQKHEASKSENSRNTGVSRKTASRF